MATGVENGGEKDVICELREQVKEKSLQLDAVRMDIVSIRDKIKKGSAERQNYISEAVHVDEAAKLVSDLKAVRETLLIKQRELKNLHNGTASEQRELERAREEVEELQKIQQQLQEQREQAILTIEELKRRDQEVEKSFANTRTRLDCVTEELSREKESYKERSSSKHSASSSSRKQQPLYVRLDHFIRTTCKQAGLEI